MASRFWAGSSSEDEDSDYSSDSSVEMTQQTRPTSRWAIDSESESDDEVRVVRSAKDKAFDQLENHCQMLKNHLKINDWSKILAEYDLMMKLLEKQKKVINKQTFPKYYVRTIVQVEDGLNELISDKPAQKKMGKENSKAFIRMKGKLKKSDADLRQQMEAFRANPDQDESEDDSDYDGSDSSSSSDEESDSESESEDESSSDDESEAEKASVASDDDSDMWPSESESSSSSESEDDGELKGRAKWLKTATVTSTKKKDKGPKVPKAAKARKLSVEEEKKTEEKQLNLTPVQFDCKVREVVALRGKRGTDFTDMLSQLRKLAHYSRTLGDARQIIALMHLVGAVLFDTSNRIDSVLSTELWRSVLNDLLHIMDLLERNPGFSLKPLTSEDQADILRAGRGELKEEDLEASVLPEDGTTGTIKISGDLASFVDRLSDEYIKSLQQTDPHTSDYISRLHDEGGLLVIAKRVRVFCERKNITTGAAMMALLQVEYSYYKHSTIAAAVHASQVRRIVFGDPNLLHPACSNSSVVQESSNFDVVHPASISGKPTCDVPEVDFEKELKELCSFVYTHGDDRSKTRAMLCQIYHSALHDHFSQARDLLLMSHLQDTISRTDIPTQILFNRMMAQLGLCAFRLGLFSEAHACLSEICNGSRTKELLAQGVQQNRYVERNTEQEKVERRRQTPYHMHVNLELLECCHLTAAMLLEIPNLALPSLDGRKRVISRTLRRFLDYFDRQVFCGPPENTRDHVIAAAKRLSMGAWQDCRDLILNLPLWNLLPGQGVPARVKQMVGLQIQIEGLRTYLLSHSSEYDSLSLIELSGMFELPEKTVHSIVSKMMINEELQASWDQQTQTIVMHQVERTKLQYLALQFAEKTSLLVENNERMLDYRNVNKEDWSRRQKTDDHHRNANRTKAGASRKNTKGSRW